MSTFKVDTINNDGTNAIDATNGFTIAGNSIVQGYTSSASEPSSPSTGDLWWDSTNEVLKRYINSEWKELSFAADAGGHFGDRAVVAGGYDTTFRNYIEYFDITTASNSTDFGDLTTIKAAFSSVSDATYGVFGASNFDDQTIDYVTIATAGNATDFGDAGAGRSASASDGSRGCFAGGYSGGYVAAIEYITIATPSNTTSFGDLTATSSQYNNGMSDNTYGVICVTNGFMDYITIQTTGNASDFGDLSNNRSQTASTDDASRGIIMGGGNTNVIDYITIASTGNATDFGDLLFDTYQAAATSNSTRAVHSGGRHPSTTRTNIIQYVTIQTTGNATDHGDLISARSLVTATSGNAS